MDIQEQYSQSPHRPSGAPLNGDREVRDREMGSPRDDRPPLNRDDRDRDTRDTRDSRDDRDHRDSRDQGYESRNRLANTAEPSNVLGIFGLAQRTTENDLEMEFSRFGKIDRVDLIFDRKTGASKCFAFIYFEKQEDAVRAKEECQGMDFQNKKIRTDFSATKKAHDPTPGKYFGNPKHDTRGRSPRFSPYGGGGRYNDRGSDRGYGGGDRYRDDRGYRGGGSSGGGGGDRYRDDRGYGGGGNGGGDRYRDDRSYRSTTDDRYSGRGGGGGGGSSNASDYRDDRGYSTRGSNGGGGGGSNGSDYRDDRGYSSARGGSSGGSNGDDRYSRDARPDDERRYR